jgi:hypothetical protein
LKMSSDSSFYIPPGNDYVLRNLSSAKAVKCHAIIVKSSQQTIEENQNLIGFP